MGSEFYLLFYPIFWDKDKILGFLVEYFELLHHGNWSKDIRKIINDLNNQNRDRLALPCNPSHKNTEEIHKGCPCGWLATVWNTDENVNGKIQGRSFIGKYLGYTEYSYNGHDWFDMMRAIRNLYVHKYDLKIMGYNDMNEDVKIKVKEMQSRIRKLVARGYLDYWIEQFPDLLFIIYNHAVENYKVLVKLPGTVEDCNLRNTFVAKYYLKEISKLFDIPKRLEDFVRNVVKFSATEVKCTTGFLLYSIKVIGGPHIHFLKHPTSKFAGGIYSPNEIVSMAFILDNSTTGSRNLTCTITRKVNTSGENSHAFGFNLDKLKNETIVAKSTLIFKQAKVQNISNDLTEVLYIFTDDILSALLYRKLFLKNRSFQTMFVFTNKGFREVREISKRFFETQHEKIDEKVLCWNELHQEYQTKLFEKPFLLQPKSSSKLELKKVYSTKISKKSFSISENNLLELMHDSQPVLLSTGIPLHFNEKRFYKCDLESDITAANPQLIDDDALKSKLIYDCKVDTATVIYGSACMGKSWLLASIGSYLVTENKIVTFQKARDLASVLQNGEDYDKCSIIEKLWRSSRLQQDVVMKYSDNKESIYLLIDDFDDVVDRLEKKQLSHFINSACEKLNVRIVVTSSQKIDTTVHFKKCEMFTLKPVGIRNFIDNYFQDITIKKPDTRSSFVASLKMEYETQCKNLGSLAQTPFVCRVWCSAYEKFGTPENILNPENQLTITQIHYNLVSQHLRNHYPNYEHYVNKTILLWPYLIKSFKKRFPDFEPDWSNTGYFSDLFGDESASSPLLVNSFLQGTVNDYLIAYHIQKIISLTKAVKMKEQMSKIFWEVLKVDMSKTKFEYENIAEFLNSMSSAKMVEHVQSHNGIDLYNSIHDILKMALNLKYEQLFVSILTTVDTYNLKTELKGLDIKDKIYATKVFRHACENKNYLVLSYLIQFNCVKWDHKTNNGLTCLGDVQRYITDVGKKEELIKGINKWCKLTNQE